MCLRTLRQKKADRFPGRQSNPRMKLPAIIAQPRYLGSSTFTRSVCSCDDGCHRRTCPFLQTG